MRISRVSSWRPAAELPWAPAGHEIAWEQVEIATTPGASRCARLDRDDLRRRSSRCEPTVTVWRAPIDNETFGPGHAGRWEQMGLRDGSAHFDASTETSA